MKKNGLLLFIALLLPGCVFMFLKFFGKNEFAVEPLFQEEVLRLADCPPVSYPYHLPDSVMETLSFGSDSLVVTVIGKPSREGQNQLKRIKEGFPEDPVHITTLPDVTAKSAHCVFFLKEPFDVVLVDKSGTIRGQYATSDRDEMDRLLMEMAIILKKY